jgi:hypothetical protein
MNVGRRLTPHFRIVVIAKRGVSQARERAARAFEHQVNSGCLRAPSTWRESAGGEQTALIAARLPQRS